MAGQHLQAKKKIVLKKSKEIEPKKSTFKNKSQSTLLLRAAHLDFHKKTNSIHSFITF